MRNFPKNEIKTHHRGINKPYFSPNGEKAKQNN